LGVCIVSSSSLSFSVRLARCEADLLAAARVRAQAYGHHLPTLGSTLAQPDAMDRQAAMGVLLCRDKTTHNPIGTARVQRGNPLRTLQLESSVILPPWLSGHTRAEITRLAVAPGADSQARLALFKASYLYCLANQIRWLVIGARSDALIRIYRGLGFIDVLAPDQRVPLTHAGGLPHRILAFDVVAAERTWLAKGHGLYPFMVDTFHPDLQLFGELEDAGLEVGQPLAA
jgi:hypothetical protein